MKAAIRTTLAGLVLILGGGLAVAQGVPAPGGTLEKLLLAETPAALAAAARETGDPRRGAILFYQPYMACTKCHDAGGQDKPLGSDMTKLGREATDVYLVESILHPSKVIKKGYESTQLVTVAGKVITALELKKTPAGLSYRDVGQNGKLVTLANKEIDEQIVNKQSIMPAGLVNQLASRQQFLDLVRYLLEISDGGPERARELRPAASLYAARPLPEYEKRIDHAGMIASLDQGSFKRGQEIYNRLCINCHGTHDRPGSLPTSLRFAEGKFKNGHDPYTMYQTLTRGFGMMVQQTWMVPQQKYDVIHYVREAYLKKHNTSQLFDVTDAYLADLPKGDTTGPKPTNIRNWETMDYGPSLVHTYEVPGGPLNFAYKGIAMRLDAGPGGVSRGRNWMVFDHDTLRMAAGWSGQGFIDWNGIMFNGRHAIHPKVAGQIQFANPIGPGWAEPESETFSDPRLRGRDDRLYGPLPRKWAHYKGLYHHGQQTLVTYTVGNAEVLERPGLKQQGEQAVFLRSFQIGPRDRDMILQVAHLPGGKAQLQVVDEKATSGEAVLFGELGATPPPTTPAGKTFQFDGASYFQVAKGADFELQRKDYTIYARIKTRQDGTIFCKTAPQSEWIANGKTLFIRGGRLGFDIGWVGQVSSRRRVNDGKWHDVALTYQAKSGKVQLYVDGKADNDAVLRPKARVTGHVVRVGYTAGNFPTTSFFKGEMESVRFYQRALGEAEISKLAAAKAADKTLVAHWQPQSIQGDQVADRSGGKRVGQVARGNAPAAAAADGVLAAGVQPQLEGSKWQVADNGNLRLRIPAGKEPLRFTLWLGQVQAQAAAEELAAGLEIEQPDENLLALTEGGPPRWNQVLKTQAVVGKGKGPFAVDVLTRPAPNPWLARVRLTGFDYVPGTDEILACTWDGDVWRIGGTDDVSQGLTWRRIASGLFQPLGLKIVDGKIYVTCRDQLVVLHDRNGDGETDFYQSFNNDHQVTEHFHEFAMGLQVDAEGNFYYAKSARHAKTALVPHHGTLLRVSKDGLRTDILATGFRAANGVCLNPDGSFIVTDQEGHWNPKNRINWVRPGGFYGNMYGYHDVTDSSDSAMEQPLCWITNAFDRSPSELLWVDSKAWGPLNGSLLNISYGYGKIYVVPHETVKGQVQGGMCEFPIARFPTGVMRGRFHPGNGQLYSCGMFAWAGNQQQPGGFYRVRYTGQPVHLPTGLKARTRGMEITFASPVDRTVASDVKRYRVKTWSLKRTAGYGSKHYDEKPSRVTGVQVSADGKTVFLEIADIKPTWSMEIRYSLQGVGGEPVEGTIHNTIHNLQD
jgi:putative heme-binding domain-containing protein